MLNRGRGWDAKLLDLQYSLESLEEAVSGKARKIIRDRQVEENFVKSLEKDATDSWVPPTRDDSFLKMIDGILSDRVEDEWSAEAKRAQALLGVPRGPIESPKLIPSPKLESTVIHAMLNNTSGGSSSQPVYSKGSATILFAGLEFTGQVVATDENFAELLFTDNTRAKVLKTQIIRWLV